MLTPKFISHQAHQENQDEELNCNEDIVMVETPPELMEDSKE
jgi:hypothetical protein